MRWYPKFLQSVGRKVRHAQNPNHYRPLQSSSLRSICNYLNVSAMIEAVLEVLLCHRLQQSSFGTWWHTVTHVRGSEGETGEWSG